MFCTQCLLLDKHCVTQIHASILSRLCRVKHDSQAKGNVKLAVMKRKGHSYLMVPANNSGTCGASRRAGAEGRRGSRLRFTCELDEPDALLCLDTVTSPCANGALYKREPTRVSPSRKPPPVSSASARACEHVHASDRSASSSP